ncbi:MAG: MFS transporter [Rhodococcus sp. (in: high G+C Gram-positive bacteria)]|nr:MAG: MFS transporter [Rhodococcus sp. (in: high G+C Gram-positive bacteria)]
MAEISARRRLIGASVGNIGETYDFFLFAFSAPALAAHFFSKSDPTAAMFGSLAVFAIAFFARPVGGVLFGYVGDRTSRIVALTASLGLMGICTALVGFLPTYGSIGLLAPVLLVLCRIGQGLALGGEASGGYSYVIESAPNGKRAQWVSTAVCAAWLPAVLAALLILLLRFGMGDESYMAWGWRIPFVLGGVAAVIGLWLRFSLDDPKEFTEAKAETKVRNPVRLILRTNWRGVVNSMLLSSTHSVSSNFLLGFMFTFLTSVAGLGATTALLSNSAAIVVAALMFPVMGRLADRVGRKPLLLVGSTVLIIGAYPAFLLASSGTLLGACLGQLILVLSISPCVAGSFATQLELFPTAVRWTGHAISQNAGSAIFGGLAPLISASLVSAFGTPIAPAYYLIAIGVLAVVVVSRTPETVRVTLRDSVRPVAQHDAAKTCEKLPID